MGKLDVLEQGAQKKIDREILNGQAARSREAPPPQPPQKDKLTKAPPRNLDQTGRERPPKEVKTVEERSSDESEAWGKMQSAPIDVDQYEFATGAQIRMRNAIDEGKDALERNRYVGKQRSAQTIKIICDPDKMNHIYRDIPRETTQEV